MTTDTSYDPFALLTSGSSESVSTGGDHESDDSEAALAPAEVPFEFPDSTFFAEATAFFGQHQNPKGGYPDADIVCRKCPRCAWRLTNTAIKDASKESREKSVSGYCQSLFKDAWPAESVFICSAYRKAVEEAMSKRAG